MPLSNTFYSQNEVEKMLSGAKKIHFIGIGGVSMAQLAELTFQKGFEVIGSEKNPNARTARLQKMGIEVRKRIGKKDLQNCHAVVYTLAVNERNKEYRLAKSLGIPFISRANYFAWLQKDYQTRVAVCGMNGKSTVTSMLGEMMYQKNSDLFCGAEYQNGKPGIFLSKSHQNIIFEACEYQDSFLNFSPTLAVVLNIGFDHVDYYENLDEVKKSFRKFADKTIGTGAVLANADDVETRMTLADFSGEIHWFSTVEEVEFTAKNIICLGTDCSFDFYRNGEKIKRLHFPIGGNFQLQNALAAASAAILMGIPAERIANKLKNYPGLKRRMQPCRRFMGAEMILDYAHHPSAIKEVLNFEKEKGYRHIVCAFEPHTFSRTKKLFAETASALSAADKVILLPIYPAREKNSYHISSKKMAKLIGKKAVAVRNYGKLYQKLYEECEKTDLILLMGAGNIDHFPSYVYQKMSKKQKNH